METKTEVKPQITQERLARLGLKTVAANFNKLTDRAKKMKIAYKHYRFITPAKMEAFQTKLRKRTQSEYGMRYQALAFTPLDAYTKIPPEDVLFKLEVAMGLECFDKYEVAHIVEVKKDPLLLGVIDGCHDRFFIGQWDDDVKITDILKDNEG